MKKENLIRVLVCDDDALLSRRLADYIKSRGFDARVVTNGKDAKEEILEWQPRFVLADLMLPDGNALSLIDFINADKNLKKQMINVMVMSGHNLPANVKQAIDRGAKDYIVKPFRHEDIVKRLVFHSRSYRGLREISQKDYTRVDEATLMLHLTDLVLRQATGPTPIDEILFNLTRMVSIKMAGVRCSIIHCADQKIGHVVTSNDDKNASGIQLDLYKYPEVLHVLNTQSLIAVENVEQSSELRHVLDYVKEISFNSMIVCPVQRHGQPFGVLSLRMPPTKENVSDNEIRFVEIVSQVVSLVLSNEIHKETGDFWLKNAGRRPIPFPTLPKVKNS